MLKSIVCLGESHIEHIERVLANARAQLIVLNLVVYYGESHNEHIERVDLHSFLTWWYITARVTINT